jgi:hypothetical protein
MWVWKLASYIEVKHSLGAFEKKMLRKIFQTKNEYQEPEENSVIRNLTIWITKYFSAAQMKDGKNKGCKNAWRTKRCKELWSETRKQEYT